MSQKIQKPTRDLGPANTRPVGLYVALFNKHLWVFAMSRSWAKLTVWW